MKYLLMLAVVMVAPGCMLELLGTTAIQGELAAESATAGLAALQRAEQMTQTASVDSAIRMYRAEYGKNPASLQVLVPEYIPAVPVGADGRQLSYDPRTGSVGAAGGVIATISQAEQTDMKLLREGIQRHRNVLGYPPGSLKALIQLGYLRSIPKTAGGVDYKYNPATGVLSHPSQAVLGR